MQWEHTYHDGTALNKFRGCKFNLKHCVASRFVECMPCQWCANTRVYRDVYAIDKSIIYLFTLCITRRFIVHVLFASLFVATNRLCGKMKTIGF